MAGDEWNSMGCGGTADEWSCVQRLDQDTADAAFRTHWQTWITADDLNEIKSYGLNTVRIPVGFWINEALVNDDEYYPKGGLEYLDYIVGNCTELGLYVIMDLHGGPGSQYPGQPYTGHVVDWPGFYTPDNYERAYKFLEWMTERVHTTPAYYNVGMLQVMNEPVHSNDYPSQAADMVANYYSNAWNRIREREAQLVTADSDKLHIQFMVCLQLLEELTDINHVDRATPGARVTPTRTYQTRLSHSTTIIDILNGIRRPQLHTTVTYLQCVTIMGQVVIQSLASGRCRS